MFKHLRTAVFLGALLLSNLAYAGGSLTWPTTSKIKMSSVEYIHFIELKSKELTEANLQSRDIIFAEINRYEIVIHTVEEMNSVESKLASIFVKILDEVCNLLLKENSPQRGDEGTDYNSALLFLVDYSRVENIPYSGLIGIISVPTMNRLEEISKDKKLDMKFRREVARAVNTINGGMIIDIENLN